MIGGVQGAVEGAKDGLISGMVSGAFAGAAMSMSGNPMFCFVAGKTVLTTLGKKDIETIQVGDTEIHLFYNEMQNSHQTGKCRTGGSF